MNDEITIKLSYFLTLNTKTGTPIVESSKHQSSKLKLKSPRAKEADAPRVGGIIQLEEDLPQRSWKMGKIAELKIVGSECKLNHGLPAQLVRASERNSVVVDSNATQANFL